MEGNSNLITEEMLHWCNIAAMSNKYKKAGPPDRLMVPSTTAEEHDARGKSLHTTILQAGASADQDKSPATEEARKAIQHKRTQRETQADIQTEGSLV